MAQIGQFNANEHEAMSFDTIPAGDYTVAAQASEVRETKSGNGHYLNVEFRIMDGPYENRKLWDRFILQHESEKAVQVGKGRLSGLCRAVGRTEISDSAELHGIPVTARVKVRPAKGDYDEQSEITSYRPVESETAPTKPSKSNGGASKASPPWMKAKK